jgi:hypothetical protein
MHLKEIVGDGLKETDSSKETVKLDEANVTKEELDKKREEKSTRIIETKDGEFKTLKHLKG